MKPTHHRLMAAMVVSTGCVALLLASLGSLFNFAASIATPGIQQDHSLTVHIRNGEREHDRDLTKGDGAARSSPREQAVSAESYEPPPVLRIPDISDPPAHAEPVKDWRAIADESAKASVDEFFRQEDSRTAIWQRNRSIMFRPTSGFVTTDEKPLLSNVRFKLRSRVVGLGINVGSCFIGLPVVGIPVEERSIGITVFYCGQGS